MVTRVESPPEQLQLLQATSKTQNSAEKGVERNTAENAKTCPAVSPVATLNTPQTSTPTPEPKPVSESTGELTSSTLNIQDLSTETPSGQTVAPSHSTTSPQPCVEEHESEIKVDGEDKDRQVQPETQRQTEHLSDEITQEEPQTTTAQEISENTTSEEQDVHSDLEPVQSNKTAETNTQPEEAEVSDDESSADECFSEALTGEEEEAPAVLPNGLKTEFSLHLLDSDSPKPGSCVMEHVSVSCGQELEELLLEASLDTVKDAP